MSVSKQRRLGPTPADVEFKAMERMIEILPLVRLPLVEGLDGPSVRYGPLAPPHKTKVPLWLAATLKKKKKCRIVVPTFLAVAELEETLREETTTDSFSPLPSDYAEVAKVLLEIASDDIPQPDRVRLILKDIREARQAKIRLGLEALNPIHLGMPFLSTMEVAELRPFFTLAHKRLCALDPELEQRADIERRFLEKPIETLRAAERGELDRQLDNDDMNY